MFLATDETKQTVETEKRVNFAATFVAVNFRFFDSFFAIILNFFYSGKEMEPTLLNAKLNVFP